MGRAEKRGELVRLLGDPDQALIAITEALSDEEFEVIHSQILARHMQAKIQEDIQSSVLAELTSTHVLIPKKTSLREAEKLFICSPLESCNGNASRAAEELGIGRKTIHRKYSRIWIEARLSIKRVSRICFSWDYPQCRECLIRKQ